MGNEERNIRDMFDTKCRPPSTKNERCCALQGRVPSRLEVPGLPLRRSQEHEIIRMPNLHWPRLIVIISHARITSIKGRACLVWMDYLPGMGQACQLFYCWLLGHPCVLLPRGRCLKRQPRHPEPTADDNRTCCKRCSRFRSKTHLRISRDVI